MNEGYDHTQYGWIHYLLALPAAGGIVSAFLSQEDATAFIFLIGVAVIFLVFGSCFVHLRVRDAGEGLEVRFGPIGVWGTTVRYEDMASAAVGRTTFWDGWGMHGWPGGSVIYNVSGRDCVIVTFKRPRGFLRFKLMKIGTDEPKALAAFLSSRIGQTE